MSCASSAAGTSASPAAAPVLPRVVIVPGNGCGNIERANWYRWVARTLEAKGFEVACQTMPDPNEAKEKIWIPFIRDTLKADEVRTQGKASHCTVLCILIVSFDCVVWLHSLSDPTVRTRF
jgi:hypothetical protein